MMKAVKWILIVGAGLFLLVVAALVIAPRFIDVQKYKPHIEKWASEATGRPFRIGGRLQFSLFPWVGVALSDLHLGNPPGFAEEDCLRIQSFEVRMRLLPLLSREIEVKRFVVEGPRVVFEKSVAGQGNWEGTGRTPDQVVGKQEGEEKRGPEKGLMEGLPIKSLAVGECAVRNASLVYIDGGTGDRREISQVTLRLQDVSFDRPIHVALAGKAMACPFSVEGKVGPLGKEIGKGTIPFNLTVEAATEFRMDIEGHVVDPATSTQFDVALQVAPFSPRKLLAALDRPFPVTTSAPEALNRLALEATLTGDRKKAQVSDGVLDVDRSKVVFSGRAKDYLKPEVFFDLSLDEIDLDRYLPPSREGGALEEKEEQKDPGRERKRTHYGPLRSMVLDGALRAAKVEAHGARLQDLYVKVSGKGGQFHLDPVTVNLYEGGLSARGSLDVRHAVPRSSMELHGKGIQVGPLLQDLLKKGFLEGNIRAEVALQMEGDDPETIKQTLHGKGDVLLKDGAVVGIDLAQMVQNVKAAFGLAQKGEEKPRTDFAELHAPFVVTNGVVETSQTTLISPALRLSAAGKADLVREALDFRVEPTFVATLKGQGDTKARAGFMVPVVVAGSLAAPQFRPDVEGLIRKGLEGKLPQASDFIKVLPGQTKEGGDAGSLEDRAKDLLKQMPFGR
ncbi:MAG: AsmA family protein [Thermodesulfobacteriota bacterium]|nr:AsmA family protein [Thermodesulfobacteriota bacterium]